MLFANCNWGHLNQTFVNLLGAATNLCLRQAQADNPQTFKMLLML